MVGGSGSAPIYSDPINDVIKNVSMKNVEPRPFASPEAAARKLMEIANSVEPAQDGRIHIEPINWPFLQEHRGSPAEYSEIQNLSLDQACS
jgi:hypothetical protein